MIWFTSDTHFGHERVLGFTNRPFDNIHEMNNAYVENINKKVKQEDELYILGDFRMYMPVKVDRAMSHRRPVSHGEMAKGQLLLVVL